MTGTRQGNVDHLFRRKPFGVAGLERAARLASNNFAAAAVKFEDELAAEARENAKRAELFRRPSTSVVPHRCERCAEWNLSERCRFCGAGA